MTAQFNNTLNVAVTGSAIPTQKEWCARFEAAFAGQLRVRMFRDANSNATDPSATGTEFFNANVTGAFTVSGNNIISFGKITAINIQQAVNLLTGTSALVLEGNGCRATFTLGLTRGKQAALGVTDANLKDYDYELFEQPSATGGIAFVNGTGIKSPIYLASGVGPAAPAIESYMVTSYQWFIYPTDNTEANRVGCGRKLINVREPDLKFDRPWIAKQIGDVRRMRSAEGDGTVFGTGGDSFRYAPISLIIDKSLNAEDSTKHVQRIRFNGKPEGRWASFPYKPDFKIATDTLSCVASKIELYNTNGDLIDVIEHYPSRVNNVPGTGKPFNFHGQEAGDSATTVSTTQPTEPWLTCQMTISWQSAELKPSNIRNHLHPGVDSTSMDPTQVKEYDAWPDQWPVLTGNFLSNGLMSWRVCPKWPRPLGGGFDTTTVDPVYSNPARDDFRTQLIGYAYYPGANQQHTWYMSPGGSRHDRGNWSHQTVRWLTDPNGIRVHGAVPNHYLQWQWNLGYHNEGCHYFTNVELNKTISKDHLLYGLDAYNDTYYNGGTEAFRPDANSIRLLTQANQIHNNPYRDKNGRMFTNEYQRDDQHNIPNAAQMTYFNNDPMGAYEGRDSFNSSMLATFGMTQGFAKDDFLTRQHAWFFKQLVEMWVIGNNDPNGVSSVEAEFLATRHLGWVVDAIAPVLANPTNFQDKGMRDLGLRCDIFYASSGTGASLGVYDSKAFYFANSLMFAKQTGWLDRIRSLSTKNSQGIDLIVNGLCKASVDFFMDSNGRPDNAQNQFIPFDTANPPSSFSWSMYPTNNQQDWIHFPDGRIGSVGDNGQYRDNYPEGYNTQHYRAQFLWVLKNFLTEYNYPRTDAAITKVQGWYDQVEAQKNAGGYNWHFKFAMMSKPNLPDYVGAPIVS